MTTTDTPRLLRCYRRVTTRDTFAASVRAYVAALLAYEEHTWQP